MKLTDRQRELVAENHKLIYFVLHKNNWSIDKFYDVAAIGLCKAAVSYDDDLGYTFSTYAARVIENAVMDELKRRTARKRNKYKEVSLDDYAIKRQIEKLARSDELDSIIDGLAIRNEINTLSAEDIAVAGMIVDGYTQTEISIKLGMSEEKVKKSTENVRCALNKFVY